MLIFYGKYLDRRPFGYHNTVYDQMVGIFLPEVIMMMDDHLLRKEDPEMLALVFTAPITSLIHYCDREPEKEPMIMQQIETFVKHFIQMYGEN